MKHVMTLLILLAAAAPPAAEALVEVFACEPEWAALALELGGDAVEIYAATTALQDVHQIQARPSLIAKIRGADLVVCTGADLETGWLPVLLSRGNNPAVQPGKPGFLAMADHVALLDRPQRLDRAEGDVHPQGNPHIQLDPRNIATLAPVLAARLAQIDAGHAADYRQRLTDFSARWQQAMSAWEAAITPLRDLPIVVYHASWVYLNRWIGLRQIATIEPKPGIPPSSQYLAVLLERLRAEPARLIVYAPYQDPKAVEWLRDQTGIPARVLPYTVGGAPGTDDLFGLFEVTIATLVEAVRS